MLPGKLRVLTAGNRPKLNNSNSLPDSENQRSRGLEASGLAFQHSGCLDVNT